MVERCRLIRPGVGRTKRRHPLAQRQAGRLIARSPLIRKIHACIGEAAASIAFCRVTMNSLGGRFRSMTTSMKTFGSLVAVFALLLNVCCAQEASVAVPESGLISPDKYTNAFFGFSLPLPQDSAFRAFQLPSNGGSHSLFGLQAQKNGLTAFTIEATLKNGVSSEQARKAASDPKA